MSTRNEMHLAANRQIMILAKQQAVREAMEFYQTQGFSSEWLDKLNDFFETVFDLGFTACEEILSTIPDSPKPSEVLIERLLPVLEQYFNTVLNPPAPTAPYIVNAGLEPPSDEEKAKYELEDYRHGIRRVVFDLMRARPYRKEDFGNVAAYIGCMISDAQYLEKELGNLVPLT